MDEHQGQGAPARPAAIDMALDDVIMSNAGGRDRGRHHRGKHQHRKGEQPARDYDRGRRPKLMMGGVLKPERHQQQRDRHPRAARHVQRGDSRKDMVISVDATVVRSSLAPRVQSSLTVSNLHHEVTEADLIELFNSVGKVLSARMEFDRSGRSNGTALVTFEDRMDAYAAMDKFHNVPLDGLPMRIKVNRQTPVLHFHELEGGRLARTGPADTADRWEHDKFRPDRGRKSPADAAMLDDDLEAYMMQRDLPTQIGE